MYVFPSGQAQSYFLLALADLKWPFRRGGNPSNDERGRSSSETSWCTEARAGVEVPELVRENDKEPAEPRRPAKIAVSGGGGTVNNDEMRFAIVFGVIV